MNLAEFGDWALAQKSVGNPSVNTYVGQCVSLIQQYINKVFDVPYQARGNAKDWATNYPTSCFTKLANNVKLQAGDVLVYGATSTNQYGHIALIDVNNKFYDQNGLKKLAVAYSSTVRSGYVCVLRPKNQEKLGLTTASTTEFTVRVDKAKAMVRVEPNSNAPLGGSKQLAAGNTFVSVGTVIGENVSGNNIWYKSAKGNYVWSGGLTKI